MTPAEWSRIQQGIFAGESGGDYGALFGYQNRPNGRFSNVNLLDMTVDQALEFADPSGPYGQYVKGQVGRVATPMGAYQVVGTTLRAAKEGLGLTGSEKMTEELQDKIGQWIYKTQGTGAWEGYKPMTDAQAIGAETMQTLGLKPRGVLAPTQTSEAETKPMMQEEKPRGLLGSLGIQKMEEGAAGETGQRFYNRDSFKDTAAILAQGFGRMGIMGMEEIADSVAKQRTEVKAKNKTMEALMKMGTPQAQAAVEYINAGGDPVSALKMAFERPKSDRTALMKNYEFFISQGMSPEDAMSAVRSGPTINMPGETMKIMSDGRIAVADPAVEGGVRFVTPPGSAAAAKAQQEAEADERRQAKLGAQTGQKKTVVAGSIDTLISQIDKGGIFDLPEAGIVGNVLGRLGANQEAVDFRNELATIQANIAFDRLQQMREASKTGGALGAVSERELDLLMNAYGNINQSTSPERLKENLQTIKDIMTMIENDPTASQFYYGGGTPVPASSQPNGVSVGEPY